MLFEIRNANYRYSDGTVGLAGISASIEAGQRIAIVGSNGSGKSTLLRALNGLIELTSGSIRFEDRSLEERVLADQTFQMEFRSRVGFVFQDADAQLFNATVAEEIAFGPAQLGLKKSDLDRRVTEILAYLGIAHLADRAPFRLSGGERRKVAIASVLATNPDVILFDEPLIGLDPRSQRWLVSTLYQLQLAGKTTIIATHALDLLPEIADVALVLGEDHGLFGTFDVDELLSDRQLLIEAGLVYEPDYLHAEAS